jgi:hypothetical protein
MTTGSSTPGSNRFALVGCGSAKQDTPAPARELYTSTYFALKRQYAVEHADSWRILSAKHGLVVPDEPIAPYDASLSTRSDSYIGDGAVAHWGEQVRTTLGTQLTECDPTPTVVVLAGEDYARPLDPLLEQSQFDGKWPFRQDNLEGIGDQMHWLSEQTAD